MIRLLVRRIWARRASFAAIALVAMLVMGGCATPVDTTPSHTRILNSDQDDNMGGSFLESSDIRTMANQVCTELLTVPEISQSPDTVRIATQRIRNSTRYMVDTNILLRRLRLDLNRYSQGKLRFFAQETGQITRTTILNERQSTQAKAAIEEVAQYIASSKIVQDSEKPVRMTVQPVANTNLFNMNANSFALMLRAKIKEKAGDKVLFARPGSDAEVDYIITGEFFAESIMLEGVGNTVKDLKYAQENPEKFNETDNVTEGSTVYGNQINVDGSVRRRVNIGPNVVYKAIDPALWNSPNVTKTFNVMLVDNDDMAVLEKTVDLQEQIRTGQENANYILTGDIGSLSKAGAGQRSDYVLVTFELIDPESNEIVWEYGYEIKRVTTRSVLYR
jgi:hypothetical protein